MTDARARMPAWLPWFMWSMGALFFFLHYFVRVAPSMIVPQIMREFTVTASALGAFASYFYMTYVGCQMPLGALVDRIGARAVLAACIIICGLSTLLFASASVIYMAYAARFLFGIGAAAAFVCSIKLATAWFPPNRLSLAIGMTQALGMTGGIVATAPMPFLLTLMDWRTLFHSFAFLFFGLAAMVILLVRNQPRSAEAAPAAHHAEPPQRANWTLFKEVLCEKRTWYNALYCGLVFAPMALFGEFWGPVYLKSVHGISAADAGPAISAIFIGWAIGGPLSGALADRIGRRPVMQLAAIGGLILLPVLMFVQPLPLFTLKAVCVLFGLTNSGLVAAYTIAGEMHRRETAGFALAIANMFTILIGMILNPLVGFIMDWRFAGHETYEGGIPIYQISDYCVAFSVLPLCLLLALWMTRRIPETLRA